MFSKYIQKINNSKLAKVLLVVLIFVLGNISHTFYGFHPLDLGKAECTTDLVFINPEPGCELYQAKLESINTLQEKLKEEVALYIQNQKATRISVFSRDLLSRRFVGVNESEIFNMASLLKLPLAITYYRVAETEQGALDQSIVYSGELNLYEKQTIQPKEKLVEGGTYSYKELIERSLIYSDNTAAEILLEQVPVAFFDKILVALGLQVVRDGKKEDLVTAKSYANTFRSLFNASFISREHSNEILGILTKSTFTEGAVKKLPKDVVVAHKFGERSFKDPVTGEIKRQQLHDCGIVYAKNGDEPYTFCIMTEGKNLADLEEITQNLSLTIYKELSK